MTTRVDELSPKLPTPGDGFAWATDQAGPVLQCISLLPIAWHMFTTRQWLLGQKSAAIDDPSAWAAVAGAAAVSVDRLYRMKQVHGVTVAEAAAGGAMPVADVLIAQDPDAVLAVQCADCVPILLTDSRNGAVAAVHAGWRGLAAGAPVIAVEALASRFGTRPEDVRAVVGPSIGPCCYEVGTDVMAAFEHAAARFGGARVREDIVRSWFRRGPLVDPNNPPMHQGPRAGRDGHWYFDCWSAAGAQLEAAGVLAAHVATASACTASHPEVFCSYRRDGHAAGRLVGAIRAVRR